MVWLASFTSAIHHGNDKPSVAVHPRMRCRVSLNLDPLPSHSHPISPVNLWVKKDIFVILATKILGSVSQHYYRPGGSPEASNRPHSLRPCLTSWSIHIPSLTPREVTEQKAALLPPCSGVCVGTKGRVDWGQLLQDWPVEATTSKIKWLRY